MPLFWKPYKSDIGQFLDELKTKNPRLEQEQQAGRALLWDKQPLDPDWQAETQSAKVPQQAYVYQTKPDVR